MVLVLETFYLKADGLRNMNINCNRVKNMNRLTIYEYEGDIN